VQDGKPDTKGNNRRTGADRAANLIVPRDRSTIKKALIVLSTFRASNPPAEIEAAKAGLFMSLMYEPCELDNQKFIVGMSF
jgi:hypothetical protein